MRQNNVFHLLPDYTNCFVTLFSMLNANIHRLVFNYKLTERFLLVFVLQGIDEYFLTRILKI